ncbi:MAG: integrase zinc binding domain-containing protein, partial [bacterium]
RQLSFIAEFTSDIRHTPGQENVVADTLSRPPPAAAQPPPPPTQHPSPTAAAEDWPEEGLAATERPFLAAIADAQPVDFAAMAADQRSCSEVAAMTGSPALQITTQAVGDTTLLGDVSTGVFRPLVPRQYREAVFQSLHSIHQPGVRATRRLITARFCWPQMAKAITLMAGACLYCHWGKVHKHVHPQPAEIPVPHLRFANIHVDLVR